MILSFNAIVWANDGTRLLVQMVQCGVLLSTLLMADLMFAQDQSAFDRAVQRAVDRVAPTVIRLDRIGGTGSVQGSAIQRGPGSALVVDSDGYVLTASWFLVDRPASILATLPDGSRCSAEIVSRDRSRNVTLLKLNLEPGQQLVAPKFADVGQVRVGQTVIAVGRGFDANTPQLSTGIVSAKNRIWGKAIQTDANVSAANYGGALVDLRGQVLGLLVPLDPNDDGPLAGTQWYDSGIGFAVPLDALLERIEQLKQRQDLLPGKLGVTLRAGNPLVTPPIIDYCQGSSTAAQQGLRPGDRIKSVDGRITQRLAQLKHVLGPRYAGDIVKLKVDRDGQALEFSVPLVDALPPFQPVAIGLRASEQEGVVIVTDVIEGSPAAKAGLASGDQLQRIDQRLIASVAEFRLAVASVPATQPLVIEYKRDGMVKAVQVLVATATAALPPAKEQPPNAAGQPTGQEFRIADASQPAYLILPPGSEQPSPLLVWLPPAGPWKSEQVFEQWKLASQNHGLAVLVFASAEQTKWDAQQPEVILRAIDTLSKQQDIDKGRIAIGGRKAGGTLASRIAFDQDGMFSGLILADAGLSKTIGEIINRPSDPTMVLLIGDREETSSSQELLLESLVPVATMAQFQPGEIARWIGWVDRL